MKLTQLILTALITICCLAPFSAKAEDWDMEVQLYLMATSIEGDASVGRVQETSVDVDFETILENLELGGMMHFEAIHKNGWGAAIDYSFMDLGSDISGPQEGIVDAGIRQGVLQADVLYRVPIQKGTFDWLAGIRWWDNDFDLTINAAVLPGTIDIDVTEDWIDVFIGGRVIYDISDSWQFMFRGDIGGFGLEADFTGQLFGGFRWNFTHNWALDMSYKAVWVDYETGNSGQPGHFHYDTVTHGPILGVTYKL